MGSEDHYTALIQSSGDAIVAKDLEGRVVSWNPAAERLFGWRADEMIGQSIRRLLPPDRQHEEDDILAHIRSGEQVGLVLTERVHRDGHNLFVGVTISPIRDASGNIVGACKIARDASERMQIERRLRDSEVRFRMLADNISQLAWMAGEDGRIFWYNQRWTDYTGFDEHDRPDHEGTRVVHPDHAERVFANYMKAIESGTDYEDTFPLRGADGGYRWFLSRAKPIRDPDGAVCWFGTNTDITEQRDQAEAINVLLREVNHRSKNMLAKIQALARSSLGGDAGLVKRFEERVGSLAVNQDILVRRDWGDVPVRELVDLQLAFVDHANAKVTMTGDEMAFTPRASEIIGMALHELATNSLKYGALSLPEGQVAIDWGHVPGRRFQMTWHESGGPAVAPPDRRGFGSQLIVDIPARSLEAEVRLEFGQGGVVWQFTTGDEVLAERSRLVA
jgi:PAS domain S-box-containing protein